MTKKVKSVGVIPVRKDNNGNFLFLLVRHGARAGGHWTFPKGGQNDGEDELEAAKRELYEETGIREAKIDPDRCFMEHYSFQRNGVRYDKEVKYFVGFVSDGKTETPAEFKKEITETRWLGFDETLRTLTFPEARNLLEKAVEIVIANNANGGRK